MTKLILLALFTLTVLASLGEAKMRRRRNRKEALKGRQSSMSMKQRRLRGIHQQAVEQQMDKLSSFQDVMSTIFGLNVKASSQRKLKISRDNVTMRKLTVGMNTDDNWKAADQRKLGHTGAKTVHGNGPNPYQFRSLRNAYSRWG